VYLLAFIAIKNGQILSAFMNTFLIFIGHIFSVKLAQICSMKVFRSMNREYTFFKKSQNDEPGWNILLIFVSCEQSRTQSSLCGKRIEIYWLKLNYQLYQVPFGREWTWTIEWSSCITKLKLKACFSFKMSAEIHITCKKKLEYQQNLRSRIGENRQLYWITLNVPNTADEKYTKEKSSLNYKTSP